MQIFFCSHCGQRFSETDLSEDQRENQDFTRVLCSKCVTAPMRAISGVPLAAGATTARLVSRGKLATIPGKRPSGESRPVTGSASAIPVPQRTSGKLGAARMPRDAQIPPVEEAPPGSEKKWALIGAGVAAVFVIGGMFIFMGGKKEKEKLPVPAVTDTKPKSMILDEKPLTVSTAKPQPPDPANPNPNSTQTPTPTPTATTTTPPANDTRTLEERADAAFDQLRKDFNALPKEDTEGRAKLCQDFLKDYNETLVGARVRSMLASVKGPPPNTPPPTPAAQGADVPLKANEEVLAKAGVKDFSGGEFYNNFMQKGADGRAVWGIKTPNYRMQVTVKVDAVPTGEASLALRTLRHEIPTPVNIRIELNDQVIFAGREKNTEPRWQYASYPIPAGILKAGDNLLKIVCTEDSDRFHAAPWFMLNAAAIVAEKK